jgi:hypothetical protein
VTSQKPRRDRGRLGIGLLIVGGVLAISAAAIMTGTASTATDQASTERSGKEDAQRQTTNVAERAIAVCTGATAAELAKLNAVGLCRAASDAKAAVPTTPPVPFAVVRQAVDAYFAANPVKNGPPPADDVVLRFVRQVYDANKPADGKTPTDAELLALVQQVYAANPPAAGKDGKNGQDGKNAHCYDQPDDPACQPKQGVQGVSVVDLDLDGSDGTCRLIVTLFNPANGETTQTSKPVDLPCGQSTPPESSTSPPMSTAANPVLPIPTN